MFDFLKDIGNYESRAVARYEDGHMTVDTAAVSDGKQPYETAVSHPRYHGGHWVIVEAYDTKEEAQAGHDRWVATMTADELPTTLVDCHNAHLTDLGEDDYDLWPSDGGDD